MEVHMPVAMEVNLSEPQFVNAAISGDGTAIPKAPIDPADLPALIAVRLRWHRRFRRDRSLDYNEKELQSGQIVHLEVHYALSPGERKTAFVEIINKKNGQKLESNRALFEGQPIPP
jgi:hypothetical protein